jgi:hypothetical protein
MRVTSSPGKTLISDWGRCTLTNRRAGTGTGASVAALKTGVSFDPSPATPGQCQEAALRSEAVPENPSVIPLSIGAALLALVSSNAPSQARTPYDGLWSVSLGVDQGSCESREIDLFIRNGEISHAGDSGFFTADGRVDERGRVEVSIGAFGVTASADGQLSDRKGRGVWQFPERGCSGQWLAERRSA